eukprot:15103287-Alexandrium_andersonii.AAC.1
MSLDGLKAEVVGITTAEADKHARRLAVTAPEEEDAQNCAAARGQGGHDTVLETLDSSDNI